MADIAVTTAGRVHVVGIPEKQLTLKASVDILAGAPVYIVPSSTGAGEWALADASGTLTGSVISSTALLYGIATRSVLAGQPLTAIRRGRMSGFTFSQAYGLQIWLSDTVGRIADAPGTVVVQVGNIVPTTADVRPDAYGKVLDIDVRV
jgi:hypothetical protein